MGSMTIKTVVIALGVLAALSGVAYAETFNVGDDINWTVNPDFNYTDWAAKTGAKVGDSLVFKYAAKDHDVRRVSAEQYKTCEEEEFVTAWSSGEDTIVLNSTGTWYFLCSKPQHCGAGQKFSLTVAPEAESPDSPTVSTPPPPPTNSAASLLPCLAGLSALSAIVLSFTGGL